MRRQSQSRAGVNTKRVPQPVARLKGQQDELGFSVVLYEVESHAVLSLLVVCEDVGFSF